MDEAITVKRPDLGAGVTCQVTAKPLTVRELEGLTFTVDPVVVKEVVFSRILQVNGEPQDYETFWRNLPPSVFKAFEDAFIELVPYEDREYTGIVTKKERDRQKKEDSSAKKSGKT